jgi:hypothetical protein
MWPPLFFAADVADWRSRPFAPGDAREKALGRAARCAAKKMGLNQLRSARAVAPAFGRPLATVPRKGERERRTGKRHGGRAASDG